MARTSTTCAAAHAKVTSPNETVINKATMAELDIGALRF